MYLSLRNFTFGHVCFLCSIMSSNRKNNEPELKLTEEQTFKIIELYHEETSLLNVGPETYMNTCAINNMQIGTMNMSSVSILVFCDTDNYKYPGKWREIRTYVLSAYCVNGKAYVFF